jgi:hypothetical protein
MQLTNAHPAHSNQVINNGRKHPKIDKARDAKLDTSAQHRALQALPRPG